MRKFLFLTLALLSGWGCSEYGAAKTWADTVCNVVHALPESSQARLAPSTSVVIVADSASVSAKVIAPVTSAALRPSNINVGY